MIQQEYYKVELPGKLNYDSNVNVEVKKITPFDQKKFYSEMMTAQNEEEQDKIVLNFVKKLTKCENIEFEDLYYPDYIFLLYQIREVTYKLFPLKYYYTCPDCGQRQGAEIKISELQIESLDEKIKDIIELDEFGEVAIRYKTLKDDITVSEFLKKKGEKPDDIFMRILAAELLLLDKWQPLEETWEMAKTGQITAQDINRIEEFVANNSWGVKEEVKCKCQKCGKEVAESYNIDPASFFSANND